MRRRARFSRPMDRRWLGALALGLIGVAVILIEALRATHRRPHLYFSNGSIAAPRVPDPHFTRALELSTGIRIDPGNRVSLLLNGDGTYPPLWSDLSQAHSTITMQMYYALPGRVSDTLARILCDRARHGVEVRLLLDAFGSAGMPRSWRASMTQCGVSVALLRGLEWFTIHSATQRSHVRAVIVDGRIGYTGGFGLADYWLGDGHHADQWRETNIRFEGPAVQALQAAFAAAWHESTGEWLVGDSFFSATRRPGPRDRAEQRPASCSRAQPPERRRRNNSSRSRSEAPARASTSRTPTSCPTPIFDGCSPTPPNAASTCAS